MLYVVYVGFGYSTWIIEMGLRRCIWVGFCCCHFEVIHNKTTWKEDTFVVLDYERGDKYRQYKKDAKSTIGTRKYDYPFRLKGRQLKIGEGWVLRVLCGSHNHDVAETLVNHPYVGWLTLNEKTILTDMIKNMVKPKNILLTLKEHNDKNVTTIIQVYIAKTTYWKSLKGRPRNRNATFNVFVRAWYVHSLTCNKWWRSWAWHFLDTSWCSKVFECI